MLQERLEHTVHVFGALRTAGASAYTCEDTAGNCAEGGGSPFGYRPPSIFRLRCSWAIGP
jgi:hypothetical protein